MSYLRYLYLLTHSGVQHILYCVFVFSLSSCVPYVASFSGLSFFDCPFRYSLTFIYRVYPMLPVSMDCPFLLPLRYSLTFIYLVYPMLPVSLDCPFLIALSVFSNVYLSCVSYVASFSGLFFFDCPFGML